ncbi:hypothetical protein GKQ38_01160 [Candidatus Nanohaloarchaea archaeon]|nr:hypothetical protein GKQ38_01160 [Candidatus Nanohaloarchaea archaeon]
MAGIAGNINRTSDAWKADYWDRVDQVEDETGLDFSESIDDIEKKEMPALASMEKRTYSIDGQEYDRNVLNISNTFDYLNPELQQHVLSHEGIHALDFENELVPQLEASRNISPDAAQRISVLKDQGRDRKEGVTQAINKRIAPDASSHYFYPDETREVEQLLEQNGTDLDSELLEETQSLEEDIVDAYREIDAQVSAPGLYFEYGSFNGTDYSVMVLGEDAEAYGGNLTDDYLLDEEKGLTDLDYDEFVDADLEKYDLD